MEISINEYVRTPEMGFIGKLVEINKDVLNYYKIDVGREIRRTNGMSDNYIYSRDGFGLRHSKDIIDLIEVGDYVNGKKVIKTNCNLKYVDDDDDYGDSEVNNALDLGNEYIYFNFEIKTIITKEQIEQIEYRIKE